MVLVSWMNLIRKLLKKILLGTFSLKLFWNTIKTKTAGWMTWRIIKKNDLTYKQKSVFTKHIKKSWCYQSWLSVIEHNELRHKTNGLCNYLLPMWVIARQIYFLYSLIRLMDNEYWVVVLLGNILYLITWFWKLGDLVKNTENTINLSLI